MYHFPTKTLGFDEDQLGGSFPKTFGLGIVGNVDGLEMWLYAEHLLLCLGKFQLSSECIIKIFNLSPFQRKVRFLR